MSKKTFCDRCGKETTDVESGTIIGIPDADEQGNGDAKDHADVCSECYRAVFEMLAPQPKREPMV